VIQLFVEVRAESPAELASAGTKASMAQQSDGDIELTSAHF